MTIGEQDEREARLWLANAENRQKQNSGKYKYVENDDVRHRATIRALLDAAEAGMRARDAALDEALSASGVIDFLRFELEQAGGQKEWALANGVSPQLVNDVLHGRRAPSAKICKPLGLVRTTRYVRAPRGAA